VNKPLHNDAVGRYTQEFKQRWLQSRRQQQAELKQDFFTRITTEYLLPENREPFEIMLQGMLSPDERERIEKDPDIHRAWKIFVDYCWMKRQTTRGIILFSVIAVATGIGLFLALHGLEILGSQKR
jgi:hypothetical protein